MKPQILVGALGLSLLLSGCVISVDGDGHDGYHSDWKKQEKNNRKEVARLEPNLSTGQVMERLGVADFSEFVKKGDDQYHVLYYRTQRKEDDGVTTKDECTPLVLKNDQLVGWGDAALSMLNQ
ncbi:DUF3192 domain-containing protein [Paraglaciecola polaris]|uniref:Lipoprotein n=1 Tax=Paraglaciecola polaris LMG 21857 TaxID=1129793 RepID=K6ZBL5_9ALTE|nr:DUF3192 domain-containing protein [Paraglaciecola polaris]GAC33506.1 hypothetical protein GPLA_2608 [Paraglaciecola polaris LMG 21857]|tara:strand:+ start:351 stop:719 length:369 start_codon:yes stop_codon:yes gene_type:complete